MRILIALALVLISIACAPKHVDNPAENAQTYSVEEYDQEYQGLDTEVLHENYGLVISSTSQNESSKKIQYHIDLTATQNFLEKPENQGKRKEIIDVIQKHIESIDRFLLKYDGFFRIRYSNGDLKLIELSTDRIEDLIARKQVLAKALKDITSWLEPTSVNQVEKL